MHIILFLILCALAWPLALMYAVGWALFIRYWWRSTAP